MKKKYLKKGGITFFWLIIWQIFSLWIGNAILFAGPIEVFLFFIRNIGNKDLIFAALNTLACITIGLMVAFLMGVILSVISYKISFVEELLEPIMLAMKSIPVAAISVVLLLLFRVDGLSKIVVFLIVVPNVYGQILQGLKGVDQNLLKTAHAYGLPVINICYYIYRPCLKPFFLNSVKLNVGLAFKAGIAAEIIGVQQGTLGESLYYYKIYLESAGVLLVTLLIIVISYIMEQILYFSCDKLFSSKRKLFLSGESLRKDDYRFESPEVVGLENITKSFEDKKVLEQVSMTVNENEIICIMGESGIGKTTLFQIMLEFVKPDCGNVKIFCGENKKRGVLFQEGNFVDVANGIDNVELFVNYSLSDSQKKELEELVGKEDLQKTVDTYSGGMKRRIEIARTMFCSAPILFMDEPFNGLDKENKRKCIDFIKRYQNNRPILLITHELEDARMLGGKIWTLE